MAPIGKDDIDAIAEAVMQRHASGEIPANGTSGSQPPHRVDPAAAPTVPEPTEHKSWWEKTRVPLAAAAGAFLALGGGLITVGVSWGGSQADVAAAKAEIAVVKAEVAAKADAAAAADIEKRVREVEKDNASSNAANASDHKAIVKELAEQKVDVKEIRTTQIEQDKKLDRILAKIKTL